VTHDLLSTALNAAERGWHVFPLRSGTKRPAIRAWEQRATTDPERIARCDWRSHGIGIACGPSRLVVVDLDVRKPGSKPPAGWESYILRSGLDVLALLAVKASESMPGDTYTVATGSGGRHLYFAAPDGMELRNTAGRLGWLIDTRAAGGYVVAAGSVVAGRPYTATDGPVADLPVWIGRQLTTPIGSSARPAAVQVQSHLSSYLASAIADQVRYVVSAPEGKRNNILYIAAQNLGQLVAGGALTEQEVRDALTDAAAGHVAAGAYSERKATETITSGLRAGAKRPRKVAA
jgi:hypothetical protein